MTQHSFREQAIAGGLHAHSVGSAYPFHPVYIANGDKGHWEVHNLMTGKVLTGLNEPVTTETAELAGLIAESYALGKPMSVWRWA